MMVLEKKSMEVGFIAVDAVEDENGGVVLTLTSSAKGKLAKAKLGIVPLPLKLSIREGTKLSFTLTKG
jgi:hypothetical protein